MASWPGEVGRCSDLQRHARRAALMQEMAAACDDHGQIVSSQSLIRFCRRACFLPADISAVIPWRPPALRGKAKGK